MNGQRVECPHCHRTIGLVDGMEIDKRWAVRKAAKAHRVSESAVNAHGRTARVVAARHDAWLLLRERRYSFPEIGEAFGFDQSTIQYGVKRAKART